MESNLSKDELLQYFNIQEKIEKRLDKIKTLIDNIWPDHLPNSQEIEYMYMHEKEPGVGFVLSIYGHTYGNFYDIPIDLLYLADEELEERAKAERKKYEDMIELEIKRNEQLLEEKDRKDFERLSLKFGAK